MFRFATPEYFYLLILVPVLIGVYWYSVRVRRRALERFGDPETIRGLMPEASPKPICCKVRANNISPTMVSRQGTAIGAAIDLASQSFSSGSDGSRVIVIISDGENHEDDAIAAAKAAAEKGIKIYTIGIGSPEGAPIPIDGNFIKDEKGNMVVSKLDEATLEQIALSTGGAYIRATNRSLGLDEIVKKINEVEKKQLSSSVFEDFNEQYQYLIGIGLLLLLIEFVMLERKSRILSRLNIFRKQ